VSEGHAMQIIVNRSICEDVYAVAADDEALPAAEHVLVSFARYLAEKDTLLASGKKLGVRLPSDKLPKDLPDLGKLAMIAVEFPKFTDGRGNSIGRMLREREKFTGELRAVGHVLRDQLIYMERCGFNAFVLAPGKSITIAIEAFAELPVAYQATVKDPRPLYRRRTI